MKILIETPIAKNFLEVFSLFNVKLFKALKPPLTDIDVIRFDGCAVGDEVHLQVKLLYLIKQNWKNKITSAHQNDHEASFTDEGLVIPTPMRSWKHVHTVRKVDDDHCVVVDDIDYTCGSEILDRMLYPVLWSMFKARGPVYIRELS